jgi:hypothetical protein
MPLVRPTFVGMHDKLASHGFAPNEMTQLAPLGAASAEFNEDDARNAAQINNKGKRKLLLIIARIRRHLRLRDRRIVNKCNWRDARLLCWRNRYRNRDILSTRTYPYCRP